MHRALPAGIGSIPETGRGQSFQSPRGGGGPDPAERLRPRGVGGGGWSVSLELWEAIAGLTAGAGMVGWRAIGGQSWEMRKGQFQLSRQWGFWFTGCRC